MSAVAAGGSPVPPRRGGRSRQRQRGGCSRTGGSRGPCLLCLWLPTSLPSSLCVPLIQLLDGEDDDNKQQLWAVDSDSETVQVLGMESDVGLSACRGGYVAHERG